MKKILRKKTKTNACVAVAVAVAFSLRDSRVTVQAGRTEGRVVESLVYCSGVLHYSSVVLHYNSVVCVV